MLTYLLWVTGIPLMEFRGEEAATACELVAKAVEGTYHAATTCALLIAT